MQNKVLMIVGMHRSGTSLTSQWLSACGLHLGDRLLDANHSNQKGHYEDLDFLAFHKDILSEHEKSAKGLQSDLNIRVSENDYFAQRGRSLIDFKNRLHQAWGWKEPRTCLFLDFYHSLLPNAKALIVYRDRDEVVDSLIRRDFKRIMTRAKKLPFFKKQLVLLRKNHIYNKIKSGKERQYQQTWDLYNQKIIAYLEQKNREDVLVISLNEFAKQDRQIFNYMKEVWEFPLKFTPYEEVFEKKLLKPEGAVTKITPSADPQAMAIMEKLRMYEVESLQNLQGVQAQRLRA